MEEAWTPEPQPAGEPPRTALSSLDWTLCALERHFYWFETLKCHGLFSSFQSLAYSSHQAEVRVCMSHEEKVRARKITGEVSSIQERAKGEWGGGEGRRRGPATGNPACAELDASVGTTKLRLNSFERSTCPD